MFPSLGFEEFKFVFFRLCSMNQLLYMIDFQTMPMGFGLVLNRLRGVVGVIWRPVGASGKRCEEVFPYL